MCLIIHKPADLVLTRTLADDVYARNHDGFGIIFFDPSDNSVNTVKTLGNRDEIWEIIKAHNDKELLMHWRMKTHGNIDFENCHPYELIPQGDGAVPSYMMHNGVLSTGNSRDISKSDTWHYIRNFLRPMLKNNEEFLHNPAFNVLVGEHIGASNKFAIMDATGRVNIVNRKSGIEHQGLWFSNTYAWNPSKFGYTYSNSYQGGKGSGFSNNSRGGWESNYYGNGGLNNRGSLLQDDDEYAQYWRDKTASTAASGHNKSNAVSTVAKTDEKPATKAEPKVEQSETTGVTADVKLDMDSGGIKQSRLRINLSEVKADPSLRNFTFSTNQMMIMEAAYQEALMALDDKDGNLGITRAMIYTYVKKCGETAMTKVLDNLWDGQYSLIGFMNVLRCYVDPTEQEGEPNAKKSA